MSASWSLEKTENDSDVYILICGSRMKNNENQDFGKVLRVDAGNNGQELWVRNHADSQLCYISIEYNYVYYHLTCKYNYKCKQSSLQL